MTKTERQDADEKPFTAPDLQLSIGILSSINKHHNNSRFRARTYGFTLLGGGSAETGSPQSLPRLQGLQCSTCIWTMSDAFDTD